MARDVENTRRRLLAAARTEFAEFGPEGARVDRIAAAAGVNKERIYGHFGSKEDLFDLVLASTLIEAAEMKAVRDDLDPASYTAAAFDFHRANPELIRLLMWESLQRPRLDPDTAARRARLYTEHAARLGVPGGDPDDGRFDLLVALALATWAQALPTVTAMVMGGRPDVDELRRRLVQAAARATSTTSDGPPDVGRPRTN